MARWYWPGLDPIGRRFRSGADGESPPWACTAAVLLFAGALVAYLPARRASRVEPVAALRME